MRRRPLRLQPGSGRPPCAGPAVLGGCGWQQNRQPKPQRKPGATSGKQQHSGTDRGHSTAGELTMDVKAGGAQASHARAHQRAHTRHCANTAHTCGDQRTQQRRPQHPQRRQHTGHTPVLVPVSLPLLGQRAVAALAVPAGQAVTVPVPVACLGAVPLLAVPRPGWQARPVAVVHLPRLL
jgi:hypothetical protein